LDYGPFFLASFHTVQKILTFKPITWVLARGFLLQFIEEIRIDTVSRKKGREKADWPRISPRKKL